MAEAITKQIGATSAGQDITEYERAQEGKMLRDLARRLREFSCLSEIDGVMKRMDSAADETFAQVVRLIPSGWQCRGGVCSRIIFEDKTYETENFEETQWKQTANIRADKKKIGCVEIHCLSKPRNDHSFHHEEKPLLNGIAKLLGLFIERERADAELRYQQKTLQTSENSLREFLRKTLSDREEEKKKLSINLHDELGSMAVSLGSILSVAEEEIKENNPQAAIDSVRRAKSDLKKAISNMKQIARDLRPQNLEIIGLPGALKDYLENIASRTDIKTDLRVDVADGKSFNGKASIVLYRVFQEALNNVLRHSGATSVKAKLQIRGGDAKLEVRDNGMGFDTKIITEETATSGMGVRGMRERVKSFGGVFKINSAPEKGTRISVTVPIG